MKQQKYDLFISYRRKNNRGEAIGTLLAHSVFDHLNDRGYKGRVFIDHEGIKNEDFEAKILNSIKNSKVFILLLTKDTLSRCVDPNDWVRSEICQAVESGLKIVAINYNEEFTEADFPSDFPAELNFLRKYNWQSVRAVEFKEDLDKVITEIIKPTLKIKNLEERVARREARKNRVRRFFAYNKKMWVTLSAIVVLVATGIPIINWIKEENVPFSLEDAKTLGDKYYEEGEYDKAIPYLEYAARKGYALAQNHLGFCYLVGQGVEQNNKMALKWFRRAAKLGDAMAQDNLGAMYLEGVGVSVDYAEAVRWFRKAAEQDFKYAQYNFGRCYHNGQGVLQDYAEAVKWYRKAADQGHIGASYELGSLYLNGHGVSQNYSKAAKWFRKAAEQDLKSAQYNLGLCYYNGDGVSRDYAEAVKWWQKAAEQGNIEAQHSIGVLYMDGIGVSRDYVKAAEWFRKAAWKGFARAQYSLGYCYYCGNGVPIDQNQAIEWFRKAAKQGNIDAQKTLKELGESW